MAIRAALSARHGMGHLRVRCAGLLLGLVLCLMLAPSLAAHERRAVRPGFKADALHGQTILLLRPAVWVGAQSVGGTAQPNAAWTEQARQLLEAELRMRQAELGIALVPQPDGAAADSTLLDDYAALFGVVARAVVSYQFFPGQRLPTRRAGAFDWTVGPGLQPVARRTGARYGLFIVLRDAYGSTGRKIFQAMVAGLVGVDVTSGQHIGYAGLVDLETGDLVWLNADEAMGGDVRTPGGMHKRVGQLLEQFPGLVASGRPGRVSGRR